MKKLLQVFFFSFTFFSMGIEFVGGNPAAFSADHIDPSNQDFHRCFQNLLSEVFSIPGNENEDHLYKLGHSPAKKLKLQYQADLIDKKELQLQLPAIAEFVHDLYVDSRGSDSQYMIRVIEIVNQLDTDLSGDPRGIKLGQKLVLALHPKKTLRTVFFAESKYSAQTLRVKWNRGDFLEKGSTAKHRHLWNILNPVSETNLVLIRLFSQAAQSLETEIKKVEEQVAQGGDPIGLLNRLVNKATHREGLERDHQSLLDELNEDEVKLLLELWKLELQIKRHYDDLVFAANTVIRNRKIKVHLRPSLIGWGNYKHVEVALHPFQKYFPSADQLDSMVEFRGGGYLYGHFTVDDISVNVSFAQLTHKSYETYCFDRALASLVEKKNEV